MAAAAMTMISKEAAPEAAEAGTMTAAAADRAEEETTEDAAETMTVAATDSPEITTGVVMTIHPDLYLAEAEITIPAAARSPRKHRIPGSMENIRVLKNKRKQNASGIYAGRIFIH